MTVVLECRRLARDLGTSVKNRVLHGIDLQIHRGEFVALTGLSGSGKSTLLYLLGALDRASAGEIFIDGTEIGGLCDDARARLRNERLGFVFQSHFLLPEFSVLENVMIPLLRLGRCSRTEAEQRSRRVIEAIGLGDYVARRPSQLSGGQQQRVSIARAVANAPKIILADEPTGNLDSQNGRLVMDLLERLVVQQHITVVMVTHERSFAERGSRQIVLQDGRIIGDIKRRGTVERSRHE